MIQYPPILVVDIETTSAHRGNAGIVEIGAIWLQPRDPLRPFWFEMKCRPHKDCEPHEDGAFAVNGCDWHNDPTVASEHEAIIAFADWIALFEPDTKVIMAGHNVGQFDLVNLQAAFARQRGAYNVGLHWPFGIAVLDVHSLACQQAFLHDAPIRNGGMKSGDIQSMLGLPIEPKPHRALCGALLEHRALWELIWMGEDAVLPVALGELEQRFLS